MRSKEQQRQSYELTTTPIPHSPVLLRGEELEALGVKLTLGRRRGGGKVFFILFLFFIILPSYSIIWQ